MLWKLIFQVEALNKLKTLNSLSELRHDEEELLFNVVNDNKDEYILENKVPFHIQPTEKNINDLKKLKIIYSLIPKTHIHHRYIIRKKIKMYKKM